MNPTTRRDLLKAAGAAVAIGAPPITGAEAAVQSASPPSAVAKAGDPAVATVARIKHLIDVVNGEIGASDDERDAAFDLKCDIEDEFLRTRVTTVEGIAAKLRLYKIEGFGVVFVDDVPLDERDFDTLDLIERIVVSVQQDLDLVLGRAGS